MYLYIHTSHVDYTNILCCKCVIVVVNTHNTCRGCSPDIAFRLLPSLPFRSALTHRTVSGRLAVWMEGDREQTIV